MALSPDFAAELIDRSASALADQAAILFLDRRPAARDQFGSGVRETLAADTRTRLCFLADAIALEEPAVFIAQVAWARAAYTGRSVPVDHLRDHLVCVRELIVDRLPAEAAHRAAHCIDRALVALDAPMHEVPSAIDGDGTLDRLTRRYLLALLEADRVGARDMLIEAARAGTPVTDLYERVIQPAHAELGRMWQLGEITVAEEHYASAAAEWALPQLVAHAQAAPANGRTLIATTADGDNHSLGIRMVSDCFELAGWRSYFLGASTPAPDVVQSLWDQRADLLAVAASLGCHLRAVRAVIHAVRSVPEVASTPVVVGGPAFAIAPDLWRKVGADGSTPSATAAVTLGAALVDARK
jgi:methanogenic corrinoid protein MtbC1